MNISITYEPTAKELTRVSSLFIEKKPFMLYTIGFINLFAVFILIIIFLKLIIVRSILPPEGLAGVSALLWLFARRPLSEKLLYQRMKRSFLLNHPITIDISLNGLAWSGKGVRAESSNWHDIKFVIEAQNGFILPNAFSKFLWLPFRGFRSPKEIDAFRQMIIDKQIVFRKYVNWEC